MYRNLFIREFVNFTLGNKKKAEYINRLTKKRTDLSKEEIDEIIKIIDKFDNQRKEMAAVHWICNGRLILPEDMGKLDEAVELMNRFGLDYTKFEGPVELRNSVPREKRARVVSSSGNPDNYKELELDYNVETPVGELKVYFVQDDRDGQMAVREIMNAQEGKDWGGPWCLLQGDGVGGLDNNAWKFWKNKYNKTPKRAAFLNGELVAFCASDSRRKIQWWDMDDKPLGSKIPLTVERESVVGNVGDFLEVCGGWVAGARCALEDSGIDDINSMEVGYIEEKTYLYDEKDRDIVVDTRYIPKDGYGYFKFKKGNVEFDVRRLNAYDDNDRTYSIAWMRKDNGDGTRTTIRYDGRGRRESKSFFKKGDDTKYVCLKQTEYHDDGKTPERERVHNSKGTTVTEFYADGRVSRIEDHIDHEKCWLFRFKEFGKDGELKKDGVYARHRSDIDGIDDKDLRELEFSRAWNKGKIVSIVGCIDGRRWLVFLDEEGKGKTLEMADRLWHNSGSYGEGINLKDENVDAEYKDIAERLIEKYREYPTNELN